MKNARKKAGSSATMIDDITHKYVPYWPLLVLLIVPCMALAWVYLKFKAPVYEIAATIQVKDEKKGVDEDQVTESLNVLAPKNIVENEVDILKSKTFVSEVVNDLLLYAPTFQKGKYAATSAYLTSPVRVESEDPANIQGVPKVPYAYDFNKKTVQVDGKSYPIDQFVATPYGRLRFTQNPYFKKSTPGEYYFSLIHPKAVTEGLYGALDVTATSKLSSVVKITFKDQVPQRGEDIVNALIKEYNGALLLQKTDHAKGTMAFLDQRIGKVLSDLNGVERRVQNFRTNQNVVSLTDQARLYLQNVAMNDQKVGDINMQLSVLEQVEKYVSSKQGTGGIVPATFGVNNDVLSKLLERYYDAEMQYEKMKSTTGENNPALQTVVGQINTLKPAILENIRNSQINLEASRSNLALTNNGYNSVLETIPAKERALIDVSREQTTLNTLYNFLLQKREQAALAYSSSITESRVIDKAQASVLPVSPNKMFTYAGALALALMITIAYILYRDILNSKVLFRSDIVKQTSYPLLGEVSFVKKGKHMLLTGKDYAAAQDEFRQICIAAGLFSKENTGKKILFTSTNEGEGKSFVTANIALGLAQAGKRVVVVDADIANSQLTRTFRAINTKGLAEYLSDDALQPAEIIKASGYKNLSVIAGGETNDDVAALFLSDRMTDLVAYLEANYDFVLIDTAPVSVATDAYILTEQCDKTLYIVRHRYTAKSALKKLDETNDIRPLKNLALIFNGVKTRGFILKTRGFGYGYKAAPPSKNIWQKLWVRKNGVRPQVLRGAGQL